MTELPLGKASEYPEQYAPEVLHAIARSEARSTLGIAGTLPFAGEDIWNAWELTWLDRSGKPVVATATFRIPADSPFIVESKSMKLYLNAFALCRYDSADELAAILTADLSRVAGRSVRVSLTRPADWSSGRVASLPGILIDDCDAAFTADEVDPTVLGTVGTGVVDENLHSHLLRSLCPVTNQPDLGSILVHYRGRPIDRSALLRYIVSFRRHNDFHEACVERMFLDLKSRCECERLTVAARYNRRGGIDINPFRSDFESVADNPRLWRQ